MSTESVMPSNHLILSCPLLLLPSIFPIIRVFSSEWVLPISGQSIGASSFSISPSKKYSGMISFRIDWLDLLGQQIDQTSQSQRNQSWIFIRRTEADVPILWPSDVKNWLIRKDSDAGKGGGQKEKGRTEDEMVGWHHWPSGHESEQTPGDSEGQGSLVCHSPGGHKESDTAERLNNNLSELFTWGFVALFFTFFITVHLAVQNNNLPLILLRV